MNMMIEHTKHMNILYMNELIHKNYFRSSMQIT